VHGHLVGSELLASTGQRLQELCRKQDWCFRYGGDEFVILMPETGARAALDLTSELLDSLMETEFRMKNGHGLKVGASVGLATAPEDGTTVHSIIGTADKRMYMVKADGRGKVWSL
jgi:diguanylate cyclase (GGDEF)-like protein